MENFLRSEEIEQVGAGDLTETSILVENGTFTWGGGKNDEKTATEVHESKATSIAAATVVVVPDETSGTSTKAKEGASEDPEKVRDVILTLLLSCFGDQRFIFHCRTKQSGVN